MSHRFYRDENGDPRASTGRERRLLGRFLEADIQGSPGLCDEVLAALEDIAAGRKKSWQMTGNAHTMVVHKRHARIQAESGRAVDLVLPTSELSLALLEWKILIEHPTPHRSR
jgi:uncharacterized protein YacL (UPF0231 family)